MMIREMHRTVKKKKATSMEPGDGDDKGNETACRKNKVRGKKEQAVKEKPP